MSELVGKTVRIRYFALLREERGLSAETISTEAATVGQLYNEMRSKHDFSLPQDRMSVAINDQFANWSEKLNDNDVVVFVPPVAGG
ncbi:MAG: MoaD/ThiS family protein [Candidatus Melainabacteria bacterium]|nr:MoaD/ThiS family protein [Candidatus Melainabacteria bacterium]